MTKRTLKDLINAWVLLSEAYTQAMKDVTKPENKSSYIIPEDTDFFAIRGIFKTKTNERISDAKMKLTNLTHEIFHGKKFLEGSNFIVLSNNDIINGYKILTVDGSRSNPTHFVCINTFEIIDIRDKSPTFIQELKNSQY